MTTDTVGGVWTYTRELVQGLLEAGASVALLTLGREMSNDQRGWVASICNSFGSLFTIVPTSYRLEWMEESEEDVQASRKCVASLIDTYKPDLLHCNQFAFASMTVTIPKLLVAHSDVLSWWLAVKGVSAPATPWFTRYKSLVRRGIVGADIVVAPTRWMMDQVSSIYGVPARTQVIANGISPSPFRAAQLKLMRAVSLGRLWDEAKNVRLLHQVHSKVPLLIAGESLPPSSSNAPLSGATQALPGDRAPRVQMLGMLSSAKVRELLAESAIYIATSRYEPFGLAPVEAALAGCAIVANDIPTFREVWGGAAVYYSRDSAQSLGEVLDGLACSPVRLATMADKACRHALARFAAKRMAADYLNLYSELIAPRVAAYA